MEIRIIPGLPGYSVSEDGRVFKDGEELSLQSRGGGYFSVSVMYLGESKAIPLHRLVAAAFIDPTPLFDSSIYVNHRDFNPSNNHYLNLEWVTPEENNIHLALFRKDSPWLILHFIKGKQELAFKSIYEAAEALEVAPLDIWDAVKGKTKLNGWEVIYLKFDDKIPKRFHKPKIKSRDKAGRMIQRKVKLRRIEDGKVVVFDSVSDLARKFNIDPSIANYSLKFHYRPNLFMRKYQLTYFEMDFVEISEKQMELLLDHGPKDVLVIDVITKESTIYPSAKSFYLAAGLKKPVVTNILRARVVRIVENKIFAYLKDREMLEEMKKVLAVH